jgi:hypothetical protein
MVSNCAENLQEKARLSSLNRVIVYNKIQGDETRFLTSLSIVGITGNFDAPVQIQGDFVAEKQAKKCSKCTLAMKSGNKIWRETEKIVQKCATVYVICIGCIIAQYSCSSKFFYM